MLLNMKHRSYKQQQIGAPAPFIWTAQLRG